MTSNGNETVIVDGLRTPFGKLGGGLASVSAVDLAAPLLKKLLERNKLDGGIVDEVIIGQVVQAGCGQIPSRQALIKAGIEASIITSDETWKLLKPLSELTI